MFGKTVQEQIRLRDSLARFFAGDAIDGIGFQAVVTQKNLIPRTALDAVGLTDSLVPQAIFRVVAPDSFALDDANILKWLFKPVLEDSVEISAAYLTPGGNFTTWAVNTRSGATTEYSNYEFNSFTKVGTRYLGASSTGLYELDGDTDAGNDIIAHIKSGLLQLGNSRFTAFRDAYLGMRGEGDFVLRLVTGTGIIYDYNLVASSLRSTKVPLGKGLRARYFAFELISTGQDFDLDTVEFLPLVSQRRV
jgi:hypothetical protein